MRGPIASMLNCCNLLRNLLYDPAFFRIKQAFDSFSFGRYAGSRDDQGKLLGQCLTITLLIF